ncbi:MAG TPA: aminomethyltransferase beta-barrel domain-containing protein [Anaerolineales bacterium]|nr:aminomethyltransferase beta-barrel domain-containing protein [Anaerolineales bacterium]
MQIRCNAKEIRAVVTPLDCKQVQIGFDDPQRDIILGQAALAGDSFI